ncbi:transporter [Steroidobacter cummioxidans]|uniref:transporter n=1 Tax=Steroidobacter cummioxidans TaxID=1803913 RepID=UPI000E315EE2|nr:transporter [Steroidobacter cummioxidans]
MTLNNIRWLCIPFSALLSHFVAANEQPVEQQSLDDAWWTGPLLAANASTLPQGHALIQPYIFDVVRQGRYDNHGDKQSASRTHSYGSLTYMLYGVTDRFTAGLIPTFGYNDVSDGRDSSAIQVGDISVQGQYRLTQFRAGSAIPTTSLVVQQTLPTGKYDRLGANVNDGLGAGAYTTTLALFSQHYLWMPNGRILRTRFNVSYALSGAADIEDVSVYGTNAGFRGTAHPGDVLTINSAWEYSVTREWVLALDLIYQHDASTRLAGDQIDPITGDTEHIEQDFGAAWRFGVAPAVEYNFSSRVGVIAGARWFAAGRNTSATVTPVAAINMVF